MVGEEKEDWVIGYSMLLVCNHHHHHTHSSYSPYSSHSCIYQCIGLVPGQEATSAPDVVAIGVQEVVKMRTDSVVMATASQRKSTFRIISN